MCLYFAFKIGRKIRGQISWKARKKRVCVLILKYLELQGSNLGGLYKLDKLS